MGFDRGMGNLGECDLAEAIPLAARDGRASTLRIRGRDEASANVAIVATVGAANRESRISFTISPRAAPSQRSETHPALLPETLSCVNRFLTRRIL